MRAIGHKIIAMLAQLEDFQKRLWLKKKFVVETNYCITLDRLPEDLYEEIAANESQLAEWKTLFAIDEIGLSIASPAYVAPLTVDFLRANPFLVLDTKFYSAEFKSKILASFDDLADAIDGLLVCSENFHALNLILPHIQGSIKCVYLDPPYNTGNDGFVYKDNYLHSSWLCMLNDRLRLCRESLREDGLIFISIDDIEVTNLRMLMREVFGDNRIENFVWKKSYGGGAKEKHAVTQHEYVLLYGHDKDNVAELWLPPDEAIEKKYYRYRDDNFAVRGPYRLQPLEAAKSMDERKNLVFPIPLPNGGEVRPKRQ